MFKACVLASLVGAAVGDLRMASQPHKDWKVQQRNRNVPFRSKFAVYMEPSAFNYAGLEKQRDGGGYDNFLRSNIDNEQDRRNFNTEDGKDHLPFRSYETAATDTSSTVKNKLSGATPASNSGVTEAGNAIFAKPGVYYTVPLRWNNPHSSELEVNIWIFNQQGGPYVIPVRRPTCSGEGYQDNVYTFKIPSDFTQRASCQNVGDCVIQGYAHSVESRMYSFGTPLIVEGSKGTWAPGTIKEAEKDRAFNLTALRRLCLPSSDPESEADWPNVEVYKARLSSDVYNHAYQNSDFSPYGGQQPQHISQNLQASCILKMTVGNFGELGKDYMQRTAPEARQYANKLDKKARNLIRVYETATNSIIEAIKYDVANNDTLPNAPTPAGSVECTEWRDKYDRVAGGRVRGKDRNGGYCAAGQTCLCHQDCYLGYGPGDNSGNDAYCAVLEDIPDKAGMKQVKAGSEVERFGASPQQSEVCFRCAEVGSTKTKRQNTNTYIPSFEIHGADNVNNGLQYIAPIYLKSGFLTHPDTGAVSKKGDTKAILQIYMAVLTEMWEEFKDCSDGSYLEKHYKNRYDKLQDKVADLEDYKFTYRGPVYKTTTATLADATNFKKINADGNTDKGYYASSQAWALQKREIGSSFAVPKTAGPLNGKIPESNNFAGDPKNDPDASGGGNTVYTLPPPEPAADSCAKVNAAAVFDGDITPEGDDMDGLNADADCDEDSYVAMKQAQHDTLCLTEQEQNPAYVCPEYPEFACIIPGQGGLLPGQMFTNDEGFETGTVGSAGTVVPSAVAIVLAGALLL